MKKIFLLSVLSLLISGCSSNIEIEKKVKYQCGSEVITAQFYNNNTILLSKGYERHEVMLTESSEGKKYISTKGASVFWDKGGEKYIRINGISYSNCQEIVK